MTILNIQQLNIYSCMKVEIPMKQKKKVCPKEVGEFNYPLLCYRHILFYAYPKWEKQFI